MTDIRSKRSTEASINPCCYPPGKEEEIFGAFDSLLK